MTIVITLENIFWFLFIILCVLYGLFCWIYGICVVIRKKMAERKEE